MGVVTLLLYLAAAGLVCSTVFVLLVGYAGLRFRKPRNKHRQECGFPPVTLLKPLCGLEPELEQNLESFFRQEYPAFEVIFGTRDEYDPALQVVRRLQRKYPSVSVKVVTAGEPTRPNAKVCSLARMYPQAEHDYLVISDSDVRVKPNYLQEIVQPLLDPSVGLVTCIYRGIPTGGFWSLMEGLGMSVEMTSGVLVANLLEGMTFALGPTMGVRRDVLDSVGGFGILADYCADDYVLGAEIHRSGKKVVLSEHLIDHVVINRSLTASLLHQVRWMKSTRFSRPFGHIGTVLTFAMPFGVLAMLAGSIIHARWLGLALLTVALLNRMLLSLTAGYATVGDTRALRSCWLYPVRDLLGFGFWCASFFGREIVWRNQRYRLEPGGFMMPCQPGLMPTMRSVPDSDSLATPVTANPLL